MHRYFETLTRRDVVKTAMVGSVAAGLGCAAPALANEDQGDIAWDEEHEFVIVGCGSSMFAALAAQKAGADIVVLEKAGNYGGATFLSHHGVWIPDTDLMTEELRAEESPEKALLFMQNCDLKGNHDTELLADWIAKANGIYNYLASIGVPLRPGKGTNNYYSFEGAARGRSNGLGARDAGWYGDCGAMLEESGVDLRLETPAKRLVTDADGAVVGVVAENNGTEIYLKATKGVLLATGSFDHNAAMRRAYITPDFVSSLVPRSCTGDGHIMAMEIGADVSNMDGAFGCWDFMDDDDYVNEDGSLGFRMMNNCFGILPPHSIMVGKDGRRFGNESSSYDERGRMLSQLSFHAAGQPYYYSGNAFEIVDANYVEHCGFPGDNVDEKPDWLFEFDSLEELADGMGIDKQALLDEVTRFNGFCETGIDLDFHRGEGAFEDPVYGPVKDIVLGGERPDLANPCLGPIEKAPFYAARIGRGSIGTSGGLMVDRYARVLRNGEPIPGLYASGCAADSPVYGYCGGGYPVTMAVTRAVMAVDHALQLGIIPDPA